MKTFNCLKSWLHRLYDSQLYHLYYRLTDVFLRKHRERRLTEIMGARARKARTFEERFMIEHGHEPEPLPKGVTIEDLSIIINFGLNKFRQKFRAAQDINEWEQTKRDYEDWKSSLPPYAKQRFPPDTMLYAIDLKPLRLYPDLETIILRLQSMNPINNREYFDTAMRLAECCPKFLEDYKRAYPTSMPTVVKAEEGVAEGFGGAEHVRLHPFGYMYVALALVKNAARVAELSGKKDAALKLYRKCGYEPFLVKAASYLNEAGDTEAVREIGLKLASAYMEYGVSNRSGKAETRRAGFSYFNNFPDVLAEMLAIAGYYPLAVRIALEHGYDGLAGRIVAEDEEQYKKFEEGFKQKFGSKSVDDNDRAPNIIAQVYNAVKQGDCEEARNMLAKLDEQRQSQSMQPDNSLLMEQFFPNGV